MITSARIENFKGFKQLELPDLSRITLLGGKNNVGKTAVLEALFLLLERGNPNMLFHHLTWRGMYSLSTEPEAMCAPIFPNYDMGYKIVISICQDNVEKVVEIKIDRSLSERTIEVYLPKGDEKPLQLSTDITLAPSLAFDITSKIGQKQQQSHLLIRPTSNGIGISLGGWSSERAPSETALFLPARIGSISNEEAIRFGQLDIEGKQNTVIEFLRILEPRLQSVSAVPIGKVSLIHGDIGIGRKIPVALMGEGMARLLSLVLAIATTRNGIVFIDEIDNGIHHSVMVKVWEAVSKAAREFNCQIMATTHSYECLQAAHKGVAEAGLAEEFRYVRLDRRGEDVIAKTYSHAILGAAIEAELEVR